MPLHKKPTVDVHQTSSEEWTVFFFFFFPSYLDKLLNSLQYPSWWFTTNLRVIASLLWQNHWTDVSHVISGRTDVYDHMLSPEPSSFLDSFLALLLALEDCNGDQSQTEIKFIYTDQPKHLNHCWMKWITLIIS